jgi:hypothetical protein
MTSSQAFPGPAREPLPVGLQQVLLTPIPHRRLKADFYGAERLHKLAAMSVTDSGSVS